MKIENLISKATERALLELYNYQIDENQVQVQNTRKDQEGDLTIVVFPFLRFSKKSAEETGNEIGEYILGSVEEVESISVIKGFVNFNISNEYWIKNLMSSFSNENFGVILPWEKSKLVMIEYSSPNTNKPLH